MDEMSLFLIKKLNISLNSNLSNVFPQIGNNDTRRKFLVFVTNTNFLSKKLSQICFHGRMVELEALFCLKKVG